MCSGASLVDQGVSIRLPGAGWLERKGHQKKGTTVPKTMRTELMLEFSCFTIFEEGFRFIRAFRNWGVLSKKWFLE